MVHLRAGHQHSQFWLILACFMGYYSELHGLLITITVALNQCFGVPGEISTIDESQGAFMCWSSTLTVLADSGPLHGLLITVTWALNHSYMGD